MKCADLYIEDLTFQLSTYRINNDGLVLGEINDASTKSLKYASKSDLDISENPLQYLRLMLNYKILPKPNKEKRCLTTVFLLKSNEYGHYLRSQINFSSIFSIIMRFSLIFFFVFLW